jgi:hypothetical protein
MVLDEWHLQLHLATEVPYADTERVRLVVQAALDSLRERLEERVRAETGIEVVITLAQ